MSEHVAGYADYLRDVWNKYDGSPERAQERHDERTQMVHHQVGEPFTDGRKVGWVKTEALLPYREYDRRGAEAHEDSHERIDAIKDDIKPGGPGWTDPISLSYHHDSHRALVDEGNHRLQAALEAGVSHVPVTVNRTSSTGRRGRDPYRLALWGRSQVRTRADKYDYVPGQMHPHEVMPDHLLHESSRRPDGFENWPPEKLRRQPSAPVSAPHSRPEHGDGSFDDITDLLRPVRGGLQTQAQAAFAPSENYYLASGGGKYHRINPITGQSLCRGTIACDRDSTPLIVSADQTRVHPMVCRRCLPDDHPSRSTSKTGASDVAKITHGDYETTAINYGPGSTVSGEAWAYHTPTGKRIGDMRWGRRHDSDSHDCERGGKWCDDDSHYQHDVIQGLGVHPEHRRKGVATAMLEAAHAAGASPVHSSARSDAGDAWARSVGTDVPERTTSPAAAFFDPETMQHMSAVGADALQLHPAEPMELDWMHNETPSTVHQGDPSAFGRDVEPAGRYVTQRPQDVEPAEGWSTGSTSFARPLHLDFGGGYDHPTNWKRRLSDAYGGKSGHELSQAVRADGYDGIVTHNGKYGTSEIVDLTGGRKTAAGPGDSLPEGWTHEPGKEGSAIKSTYKHADTGTTVYFPKHEQHEKHVKLTDDDEKAYIPHVHNAIQKTGEHGVTVMVDTGHDSYFKASPKRPLGSAGGYVSNDDPDTVRINPHLVHEAAAKKYDERLRGDNFHSPSSQHTDYREYCLAHELGHVHDFRNQHVDEDRVPGKRVKTKASEASFYGRQKAAANLSQYGATNTSEGYAEAFAHHHLRRDDDESPATTVSDRYSGRYDWKPREGA